MTRTVFTPHTTAPRPRFINAPTAPSIPQEAKNITTPTRGTIHAWFTSASHPYDWANGIETTALIDVINSLPDGGVDTLVIATHDTLPGPSWTGWDACRQVIYIHGDQYDLLDRNAGATWCNMRLKPYVAPVYPKTPSYPSGSTPYTPSGPIHKVSDQIQRIKNMVRTAEQSLEDIILDVSNNQRISVSEASDIFHELSTAGLLETQTYQERLEMLTYILPDMHDQKSKKAIYEIDEDLMACFIGCTGPYPSILDIISKLIQYPDISDLSVVYHHWGRDTIPTSEDLPKILHAIMVGTVNMLNGEQGENMTSAEMNAITEYMNKLEPTSRRWTKADIAAMIPNVTLIH